MLKNVAPDCDAMHFPEMYSGERIQIRNININKYICYPKFTIINRLPQDYEHCIINVRPSPGLLYSDHLATEILCQD